MKHLLHSYTPLSRLPKCTYGELIELPKLLERLGESFAPYKPGERDDATEPSVPSRMERIACTERRSGKFSYIAFFQLSAAALSSARC